MLLFKLINLLNFTKYCLIIITILIIIILITIAIIIKS